MAGPTVSSRRTIALCLSRSRNRELLTELLEPYHVVELTGDVPVGTDLCIVDEGGYQRLGSLLETWKANQRPVYAPVLLLAEETPTRKPWRQYADAMGSRIDVIQTIPTPRTAIVSQIEALVETRRYAELADDRRAQLELYEHAMDGASVGITIADAIDSEHPLVYLNEGFTTITGYEPSECLGQNCRFLQGEKTNPETVSRIRAALDSETFVSVEIRNYRKNGAMFWNALDITPLTNEEGETTHFLGFQRDITPRKTREALLERYERIVESIGDPIFVTDRGGRILYANEALLTTLGYNPQTIAGSPLHTLFDDDPVVCERAFESVVNGAESTTVEMAAIESTGRRRTLELTFQRERISRDDGGERIVVLSRDITTIREQQQRLSVVNRVLRHDTRNKLGVVLGNLDDLLADQELPDQRLQSARDAAAALLDLSETARRFGDSLGDDREVVSTQDLAALVRSVCSALGSVYPSATIETEVPTSLQAACPLTMRWCLEELIENAVVHSEQTNPHVLVEISEPEERSITLSISDDGPGMPQMEKAVLGQDVETPLEHSLGLSLWLIRWTITSAGGSLHIADNQPTGTVVNITLPRP